MPKKYKATTTRRKYSKVFRGKTIKQRNEKTRRKASTKKHYVGGVSFLWFNKRKREERVRELEKKERDRERDRDIIEQSEDIVFLNNKLRDYEKEVESYAKKLDKLNAVLEKYNKKNDYDNANIVINQANNVNSEGEYYLMMIEKIEERIKQLSETGED
jgi:hypothetical protein